MGEDVYEINKELDKLEEKELEIERKLMALRLRKMELNIALMQTPEMRKAYKEAYLKVRNMKKR